MTNVLRASSALALLGALLATGASPAAQAASPNCAVEGGTLLSWPTVEPIWELCWIAPGDSVGPRGSGLELRAIHYRGIPVAQRIHAPMLFAEYNGGTCYRDWKDDPTPILAHTSTHNQMAVPPDLGRLATTSCSVSQHPTTSYGTCPFQQATGGGYSCTASNGVVIEDLGDQVSMTSQYRADWYMYDSRISFRANGVIEPTFGFGNNNGTFNNVTHWHHNYWRFDFGIDGQDSHVVSANGVDQPLEFHDVRGASGSKTWAVRNPATGRGFEMVPGANDYLVGTNESNRGFHMVDFMATRYVASEYGDNPSYSLGDCGMDEENLVDGQSIDQQDVVLWYRVAVRDSTANNWPPGCGGGTPCVPQDSMICKNAGPQLVPFGDWGQGLPAEADLLVSAESDPSQTFPGDVVQLAFNVTNNGPQDVSQATVTLDLPAELAVATKQPIPSSWSCVETSAVLVTCTLDTGSIAATGQSGFAVNLEVDAGASAGDYNTVVTISSSEWLDPDSSNNVATATTSVVVPVNQADLSVSVTDDPDPVMAGSSVEFQVAVANAGPQDVSAATVTLELSAEFGFSPKQPASSSWSCAETGPLLVTCTLDNGSIAATGQSSFAVSLDVDSGASAGDYASIVTVSSGEWMDPNSDNNVANATTSVVALVDEADLSISASDDPDPVTAGGLLELQVTVANAGPRDVSQAVVSISLPLEFTTAAGLKGVSNWACGEVSAGMLSCAFSGGSIQAASQSVFAIPLNVANDALNGNVQTTLNVQSSQWPDPQATNNMTSVTTTILFAGDPVLIFADGFEQ